MCEIEAKGFEARRPRGASLAGTRRATRRPHLLAVALVPIPAAAAAAAIWLDVGVAGLILVALCPTLAIIGLFQLALIPRRHL